MPQIILLSLEEILQGVNGSDSELQLQATQATRYAAGLLCAGREVAGGAAAGSIGRRCFFLLEEITKGKVPANPNCPEEPHLVPALCLAWLHHTPGQCLWWGPVWLDPSKGLAVDPVPVQDHIGSHKKSSAKCLGRTRTLEPGSGRVHAEQGCSYPGG